MLVIRLVRLQRTATAQVELPAGERQCSAGRAGIRKRSEVTGAVLLFEAGEREARNRVVQIDLQQDEPFVVAETDVVTRMKFLDEFAFEQQRLRFVAHDVNVEIMNRLDQRIQLEVPTLPPRGMKVLADAFAQVARFADVNDRAE